MATVVGRIRKDNVLKNGIKYLLVSHNTKMGAAKGAVPSCISQHQNGSSQGGSACRRASHQGWVYFLDADSEG